MTRDLTLDDLYAIPAVSDPQLSPDGTTVAYVVTTPNRSTDGYTSAIWTVATDGAGSARQLTSGEADSAPRWSPDGTQLAFVGRRGDGPGQLHVLPVGGGEARRLTQLEGGASDPQWSPDGSRIAVSTIIRLSGAEDHAPLVIDRLHYKGDGAGLYRDRRPHLAVVDVASGATTQLTAGDFAVAGHAWAPDGSALAYAASATADADLTGASAVYVLKLAGGTPRAITPLDGAYSTPVWLPDGTELLVVGREQPTTGHARLHVVPRAGGTPKPVAVLDRNVMPGAPGYPGARPVVLPDRTILFAARDAGVTHIYAARVDSDPVKIVGGDARSLSGLSHAGGRIATVFADPTSNSDVLVAGVDGGDERRLTTHFADALPDVQLPVATPREFTAPDGTSVHGWVLRAEQTDGPSPLLLDIHGGPHNAWGPTFDGVHLYHQELVARGWTVLIVNPRGSDGYGEDFFTAVSGGWGVNDEHDFLCTIDTLVAEGVADPKRLVVTGYSYGGYMSCWLSSRHPDRWAAAIPGGVVSNLVSMVGTSDMSYLFGELEFGGTPWHAADTFRTSSPITYVDAVKAPTLLLHGDADDRCPVEQSEEWFAPLRVRNVPVELVRYPGGSHLFILNGRPSHRHDWCSRIVEWATRYTSATAESLPARRLAARTAGLRARLAQLCAQAQVPGAAVTVMHGDEQVTYTYGVRNVDTGEPVTPDTTFQIGSNTKLYTATLVMQLVDAGLVDLDAPVRTYVPELRLADEEAAASITVRHLLTHTSGIPGDIFGADVPWGDDAKARYVEGLAEVEQLHPVGDLWSYCNAGWVLLGRLIEKVTGKTYGEIWRSRLVDPIGATRTRALPHELLLLEPAVGHLPGPDGSPVVAPVYATSPASFSAGSLPASTGVDVVKFIRLHLDGGVTADGTRLLNEDTVALMQAHQADLTPLRPHHVGWGLGWALGRSTDGRRTISHGGGTVGQLSTLEVMPDERLAVVVLTNGALGGQVGLALARELFQELVGAQIPGDPEVPAEPPSLDLSRYEGTYVSGPTTITVGVVDGALSAEVRSSGLTGEESTATMPLTAVDDATFVSGPTTARFIRFEPDGKPRYLFNGRAYRRTD